MPESQQPQEGQEKMITDILSGKCDRVLDIGAGDGKWGKLLMGKVGSITAIEVWPDYIVQFGLENIYNQVIEIDVRDFKETEDYDVIIVGDVLEHLIREDALKLIDRLKQSAARVYLTVPISPCPQDGAVYGNPHETHWDEWTDGELVALGWKQLHEGLNANGRVKIGTYVLER